MAFNIRKSLGRSSDEDIFVSEGLQFGYGLFETLAFELRTSPVLESDFSWYNLSGHLDRLYRSARQLSIELPKREILISSIEDYGRELCQSGDLFSSSESLSASTMNLAVKLTVIKKGSGAELIFSNRPNPYKADGATKGRQRGIKLCLSKLVRDEHSELTYHKTTNYLSNLLEKRKAVSEHYDDCFFLNRKGYMTETTVSNLYFLKDGRILTPEVGCGLLPGTVRARLLKASTRSDLVEEAFLTLEDLPGVQGVAVSNALMGVLPVVEMAGRSFDHSHRLADLLRAQLEEDEHASAF